jgi:hypothetical protein
MSFTAITTSTSWQSLAIAQELATAYNKRAAAYSFTNGYTITPIEADAGDTVYSFIYAMQRGIQRMCFGFADPDITLTGNSNHIDNYSGEGEHFDEDYNCHWDYDLLTAAGLVHLDHWRRIPATGSLPTDWTNYNDNNFAYGVIEETDIAGPWLFKDLQLALSQMTRTTQWSAFFNKYELNAYDESNSPITLSGTPTYGPPGVRDYDQAGFTLYVEKTSTKYRVGNEENYYYIVGMSYKAIHLSNMPEVPKSINIICMPTCITNIDGVTVNNAALYGYTPGVTNLISTTTSSSDSVTIDVGKETSWAFYNSISWLQPVLPSGYNIITKTTSATLSSSSSRIVIDYDFDP